MSFLKLLRRQRDLRSIRTATQNGNTQKLVELLTEHPDLLSETLQEAHVAYEEGLTQEYLTYIVALACCNVSGTKELLQHLLVEVKEHNLWHKLNEKDALCLAEFIRNSGDWSLYETLLSVYSDQNFKRVRENLEHIPSKQWTQQALRRDNFRRDAIDILMSRLLSTSNERHRTGLRDLLIETFKEIQAQFVNAVESYSRRDEVQELVRQISLLMFVCQASPSSEILQIIAQELESWPFQALISAANILTKAPSKEWTPYLRMVWTKRVDNIIRQDKRDFGYAPQRIPPEDELVAYAVLAALGACAAVDSDYHNFDIDKSLSLEYQELVDERNDLFQSSNKMIEALKEEYPEAFSKKHSPLEFNWQQPKVENDPLFLERQTEVRNLKEKIKELDKAINAQRHQLRELWSPGYLLRRILEDGQQYPIGVQQGAALGIYLLVKNGHLDNESKRSLQERLSAIVYDKDNGQEFRERRILLLFDTSKLEMCNALRAGIEWMTWIANFRKIEPLVNDNQKQDNSGDVVQEIPLTGDEISIAASPEILPVNIQYETTQETISDYYDLYSIVKLLWLKLPGAVEFFTRHPLRLMLFDDRRKILGQYSEDGCSLRLWTRYTPPKDVGEVHYRYLTIDDRTSPNSMGIYYRLFRHPLLAVPVIYHEYLHYAGVSNTPSHGLKNEMEVWLRETIFTRGLFAELVPSDQALIPNYIGVYLNTIQEIKLPHFVYRLLAKIQDDFTFESFKNEIICIYGEQLSEQEALEKASEKIELLNSKIAENNIAQTWNPQVQYPLLDTYETHEITENYRNILIQRYMQSHKLTIQERDLILAEDNSQNALSAWQQHANLLFAFSSAVLHGVPLRILILT
jgi:hypothetical protein